MAQNKTIQNDAAVGDFIANVADPKRRADAEVALKLMEKVTGWKPAMWGTSIVGFGRYAYKYESGRSGEFMVVGLSPRKAALTLYIMPGFKDYNALLEKLGPYKTGKSCLYVKRLSDIDLGVLEKLIAASVKTMEQRYECHAS